MSQPLVIELAETGSTNDWIAAHAVDLPDGQWVRADRQTAGRGRRARAWVSEPGNLYASMLARPRAGEGPAPQLSFVAAVALHDALSGWVAPERLTIKWPNDLLLGGVKCAGILLEGEGADTIIGIGVNLAHHPEGTERPATSLAAAGLGPPTPAAFLDRLAARFAHWRAEWGQWGFPAIRSVWLSRAANVGGRVEARLGVQTLAGRFEDLAEDGALLLRLPDGRLRPIHAGEVFGL